MTQRRDEDRNDEGRTREEEDELREVEGAGWELVEHAADGTPVWRNPESGHLFPQEAALAFVRERARRGEPFEDSEKYSW